MVFDCIPFFNEIDILKLRLHTLDSYVDYFIIEEATMTFSGEKKELLFEKNKDKFQEFLPKIRHIVVEDSPLEAKSHERDYFQKNRLIEGLFDATREDMILFGDADEIPNPAVLSELIKGFDRDKVYHLAQRNFYAFMNMEEKSGRLLSITGEFPHIEEGERKWLGTKVTSIQNIPEEGIVRLRDLVPPTDSRSMRVPNGGWHFGYMGGEGECDPLKRIGSKVQAAAHQEYNEKEILRTTMDHLYLGEDIFGRGARFGQVELDQSYPSYLLSHLEDYSHLILPPVGFGQRLCARLDLTLGRFCRRAVRRLCRMF